MTIKIGTRGSKLALWQAELISSLLSNAGMKSEIVIIETKGDQILDIALSKIGSKGIFTEELENKLKLGEIDIAVHSAKDLQSHMADDLELIAFTQRESPNDVLVSYKKDISLNNSIVVGTSSTRRIALLRYYYPHVKIVDMRGNLQTRFEKMKRNQCDAMILANAGVQRMGYSSYIVNHLSVEQFIPPAGQGSIAVQCAKVLETSKKEFIKKSVNHDFTEMCILAERSFLSAMEGGCSIPTFALAQINHSTQLLLKGGIISMSGNRIILHSMTAEISRPEKLGTTLARYVLSNGGKGILEEMRKS